LRKHCGDILAAESEHAASLPDCELEIRQLRLTEVEFAARLRHRFSDLDTFLSAQGKKSERDMVSDAHSFELEIKYFANEVPQGGTVPLSDWDWLVGLKQRTPVRSYARYWWMILPRVGYAYGSRGPGNRASAQHGRWNFQDCLSFSPTEREERMAPFLPITEVLQSTGVRGRLLKPALGFRNEPDRVAVFTLVVTGTETHVRADLLGNPGKDAVWGMFYSVIKKDDILGLPDARRFVL
jgi:hypothetical protein